VDDNELEGMLLTLVNGWLTRHRGHMVIVERRQSEEILYGSDPFAAAARHRSMIVTSLQCRDCQTGITIRNDEPDTGDPRQLRRLYGP
jgi:hypothetical protein